MVTVTVIAPYQVVDKGIAYGPGETVEVSDATAKEWLAFGWVEAKAEAKAKAPPSKK